MSNAASWRDSSNWRSGGGGGGPRASTAKPSRPGQERSAAPSWRIRGAHLSEARPPRDRKDWISGSRPYDRERKPRQPQEDEDSAAKAIAEGRRIYIGNLRYQAKPEDLEGLLGANDLGHFESIHISIDPFTGRNPSYCFVEFPDRESADRAMSILEGKLLLGREVKCRPCQPKGSGSGARHNEGLNRWGRYRDGEDEQDGLATGHGLRDAESPSSFGRYQQDFTGRRLYVGGLPRMLDQAANFTELGELFKNFEV